MVNFLIRREPLDLSIADQFCKYALLAKPVIARLNFEQTWVIEGATAWVLRLIDQAFLDDPIHFPI